MKIKPIETEYNGIKFRSKLEAQWAVLFDTCDVDLEYEPQGFDLGDGIWYLPDFLLHNVRIDEGKPRDLYVEIKGVMDADSRTKINQFVLGDMETRKKSMTKLLKEALKGGWQMDYSLGRALPVRSLLVLGRMPKENELLDLETWIEKEYPKDNFLTRFFYSAATVDLGFPAEYRLFPMKFGDTIDFARVDRCTRPDLDDKTLEAYYIARNYRFDHKK